jgi:hypothetical protein
VSKNKFFDTLKKRGAFAPRFLFLYLMRTAGKIMIGPDRQSFAGFYLKTSCPDPSTSQPTTSLPPNSLNITGN